MTSPTTCRHYSYVRPTFPRNTKTLEATEGPQCAKGRPLTAPGCVKPCVYPQHGALCADREVPTADEVAADEAAFKAIWDRAAKAIVHLNSLDVKPGESGETACPCCGSALRYARDGKRGHWRAACATPDCVQMIQ